jgi:hypothetical protein
MLKKVLQTLEEKEDGHVKAQVRGKCFFIDQVLIHEQLGISYEGFVDVASITIKK